MFYATHGESFRGDEIAWYLSTDIVATVSTNMLSLFFGLFGLLQIHNPANNLIRRSIFFAKRLEPAAPHFFKTYSRFVPFKNANDVGTLDV